MVEALRNGWLGSSLELRQIALDLNDGKNLRYSPRLRPEVLREWASAVYQSTLTRSSRISLRLSKWAAWLARASYRTHS